MTARLSHLCGRQSGCSIGGTPVHRTAMQYSALVVVLAGVVHWQTTPSAAQSTTAQTAPATVIPNETLPANVAAVRQALLDAARSGRIDDLLLSLEPQQRGATFSGIEGTRAIKDWKALSSDGEGRSVLAEMANILMLEPAIVHAGADTENNRLFVWPYLAERKLDALTPGDRVDLLRLVPQADGDAMQSAKVWSWWRLVIGADGILHLFKKGN
jgi:hypothetical protein